MVRMALYVAAAAFAVSASSAADPAAEATAVHAANAHEASHVAVQAAKVANQVADHAMNMSASAKQALDHARHVIVAARTGATGLSADQHESLRKAEFELDAASKKVHYDKLKDGDYQKYEAHRLEYEISTRRAEDAQTAALRAQLRDLRSKLATDEARERATMRGKLQALQKKLREEEAAGASAQEMQITLKDKDKALSQKQQVELDDLLKRLDQLEQQGASADKLQQANAQVEHTGVDAATWRKLRELERLLEKRKNSVSADEQKHLRSEAAELLKDEPKKAVPLAQGTAPGPHPHLGNPGSVKMTRSLDIDTAMPYGELEPFGREDTAQELTEASIRESDEMVDQIERAEVAEEKRSVFRALTRLRGAAITSFDGVARSQTGNIDEYNKSHKWRKAHPLHHLADEESDIAKWAFPDNADF